MKTENEYHKWKCGMPENFCSCKSKDECGYIEMGKAFEEVFKPEQLITAEVMPDGTVKEINPMGLKPVETFVHPHWEYKRAHWERAEQNRKAWPVDWSFLYPISSPAANIAGQHVTGYIRDGKFVITEIKH